MNGTKISEIIEISKKNIKKNKPRSAWEKGIKWYAEFLLERLGECNPDRVESSVLDCINSCGSWEIYSMGAGALVMDGEIASVICTPSELKRYHYDPQTQYIDPKKDDAFYWLKMQGKALYMAEALMLGRYVPSNF